MPVKSQRKAAGRITKPLSPTPEQLDAIVALMKAREAPECFAVTRVSDSSEIVVINRDLSDRARNDEWDPMLRVDFRPRRSELHRADPEPELGELLNIRASELRKVADHLVAAIATAEATGVIPPELTDAEWQERYDQARKRLTRTEG